MTAQFQYTTLAHQTQAVQSIAEVFADVRFVAPTNAQSNPVMAPREAAATLQTNIHEIRKRNGVTAGPVLVHSTATPALAIDVLMETGTGKTFTFIETIHRLHKDKNLAKFIVLVPSNAIRQGTLKSLQTTAEFFSKQYGQKISIYNYSAKTVHGFINAANAGISVLVATYQSFAGDSKVINKRGVEANLFGHAKSYMEALAYVRPVLIIDELHRFEGKQTQEYLAKFNPLMTIRFGATFKNDEYKNLIYTLDSLEAFRQRLVKGIAVDTVGAGADMAQLLCLNTVTGSAKERLATVSYLDAYFSGYGKVKNKADLVKPTIRINPENYQKFKDLWQNLNRDAVLHYELDAAVLTTRILEAINTDFHVRPLTISITRTDSVESLHQAKSTQKSYDVMSQSVYTLAEFVRELANLTKLSYHLVGCILSQMPADKFEQIRHNESRALTTLRDLIQRSIYELLVNKVSYELREVRVKTSLTDSAGQLLAAIPVSMCGVETHGIANSEIQASSLYVDNFMPVDSKIERDTVDDSNDARITVFAKLPKINIPTPAGNYNPDFGYVLAHGGKTQALYLVVETKGYDNLADIPDKERWKIDSAKQFFKALQELPQVKNAGIQVKYQTKINGESLAQLISGIK